MIQATVLSAAAPRPSPHLHVKISHPQGLAIVRPPAPSFNLRRRWLYRRAFDTTGVPEAPIPCIARIVRASFADGACEAALVAVPTLPASTVATDGSPGAGSMELSLEPRHFGALSGMGLIYLAQEENEKALRAFDRALAVNPNMPGRLDYVEELRRRLEGEPIWSVSACVWASEHQDSKA